MRRGMRQGTRQGARQGTKQGTQQGTPPRTRRKRDTDYDRDRDHDCDGDPGCTYDREGTRRVTTGATQGRRHGVSATGHHGRAPLRAAGIHSRGVAGRVNCSRQRAQRGAPRAPPPLPAAARGRSGDLRPCVTSNAPLQRAPSVSGDDGSPATGWVTHRGAPRRHSLATRGQRGVVRQRRASHPLRGTSAGAPPLIHVMAACIAPQLPYAGCRSHSPSPRPTRRHQRPADPRPNHPPLPCHSLHGRTASGIP